MSLVNDITAALPGLRAEAEGRMVDACVAETGPYTPGTFDPETGEYTPPVGTVVYEGRCEIQVSDGLNVRDVAAGGTEIVSMRLTVKLPVSTSVAVQIDDEVTILVATHDPGLVGKRFRVTATHTKTFATARRLQVEEIVT